MFHLLVVLVLDMTNHLLMKFLCVHHLLVVICVEMTNHLLMTFFFIYILLVVLGLEMTDQLLMIVLLRLTFILVKENKLIHSALVRPLLCMGIFHHKLCVLHNIMSLLSLILYENIGHVFIPPCLVLSIISSLIGITSLVFSSHPFRYFLYKNFLNSNPLESFILNNLVSRNNSTGCPPVVICTGFVWGLR